MGEGGGGKAKGPLRRSFGFHYVDTDRDQAHKIQQQPGERGPLRHAEASWGQIITLARRERLLDLRRDDTDT